MVEATEQAYFADFGGEYNAEVSEMLYERPIKFKDHSSFDEDGEPTVVGEGKVWLKEMSEADVATRTRMLTQQKQAKRKGRNSEVDIHIERLRIFDFTKSIEDWTLMRPQRDENGKIIYEKEPVYYKNRDGSIKVSQKSGIPMIKEAGVPKLEPMPINPEGFRSLAQYVGDQINDHITNDINDLPDVNDDDLAPKKKDKVEKLGARKAQSEEDQLHSAFDAFESNGDGDGEDEEENPT